MCNGLDGASLIAEDGEIYSVVHAECHPGALQLSRLKQDKGSGRLQASSTRQVDLAAVGGANLFCAAERSPWNTHLAAEEFEADASKLQPDGTVSDNHQYYNSMARYWGELAGQSPYQLGWIDELEIAGGEGRLTKRYALGRFSHEQARVMPDERTVYLTDDGTNGAFFVFVSDTARDLSAGHLYASRWQHSEEGGGFELEWISLGHSKESDIAEAVGKPLSFDAMFEAQDGQECADGFTRIRTTHESRCIRIRDGMQAAASRLESRRVAGLLGATTELRKWEGMAVDPEGRRLFAAVSAVTLGMVKGHPEWDLPSADHIRMEENACGMVMSMPVDDGPVVDTQGKRIDSDWIVSSAASFVEGAPVLAADGAVSACVLDAIANPDNLAFIPEAGLLLIAEDTRGHENNVLWAMDVQTRALTRLLVAPVHAEVAGINWFPDIGGWGYLTVTIQFPDGDWLRSKDIDVPPMSTSGVIGPFPGR